jgi:hypothetical protein
MLIPVSSVAKLSDKVLLEQCVKFGREALLWRNKFRSLLPEVERRKLYLKKGWPSIYVFGKILAGLSEEQVSESLNIAGRLEDKPVLRGLLESGEVSVNKIVRVMSIATCENEGELAEQVQLLSLSAVKTLVRDVKLESLSKRDSFWSLVDPNSERKIKIVQELNEKQLEYKTLYASGRNGWASVNLNRKTDNLHELLDMIIAEIPQALE